MIVTLIIGIFLATVILRFNFRSPSFRGAELEVTLKETNKEVVLQIEDTGKGIPKFHMD